MKLAIELFINRKIGLEKSKNSLNKISKCKN